MLYRFHVLSGFSLNDFSAFILRLEYKTMSLDSYSQYIAMSDSGVGTNLKVKGHRSGAKVGGGHWFGAKLQKIFGAVSLHFFGSKSTISHFGKRFCDGHYSVVSLLFAFLLTVPPCRTICKSGGTCPPPCALWSWCHWCLMSFTTRKVCSFTSTQLTGLSHICHGQFWRNSMLNSGVVLTPNRDSRQVVVWGFTFQGLPATGPHHHLLIEVWTKQSLLKGTLTKWNSIWVSP